MFLNMTIYNERHHIFCTDMPTPQCNGISFLATLSKLTGFPPGTLAFSYSPLNLKLQIAHMREIECKCGCLAMSKQFNRL